MQFTPAMIVALAWLALLGWGFNALLRRHLRLDDKLADVEAQLSIERQARNHAERALASTHASLCSLAQRQESVREAERQRIGREIDNELGRNLLALKADLALLHVTTSGVHPLITKKVGGMMGNLEASIETLDAIISDLRPLVLDSGLRDAIEWQLNEFTRLFGVTHLLHAEAAVFDYLPDRDRDTMLFRIVQESLCNIARHAQASEVCVELRRSGDVLTLTVRDNGIGMSTEPPRKAGRLASIGERVRAVGGKFAIDSAPGRGTSVSLSLPLAQSFVMS